MSALEPGTHLLHIGPQKTGSTAVQSALNRERAALLEHGWVYPGRRGRPVHAAAAGLGFSAPHGGPAPRMEDWDELLAEIREAGERGVVISHEAFGRATDEQARRVVEELGGSRPHVIAVARRYDRLLPSQWQQRVKVGDQRTYDEWLRVVLAERSEDWAWRNVWVPHDTVSLVSRWADLVGAENFTLVVGDDADRDRLPRTFESMLGLPTGMLAADESASNRSLSTAEIELVRRLNVRFAEAGWSDRDRYDLVTKGLTPTLVRTEVSREDSAVRGLPEWAHDRVVELSEQRFQGLQALGVNVVGDLELLRVDRASVPSTAATEVETVPVDIAVRAMEGLVVGARRLRKHERRARRGAVKAARRRAVKETRRAERQAATKRAAAEPAAAPAPRSGARLLPRRVLRRVLGRSAG
ncbi:hypothetical protein [Nocardioides donggukensis]|uniref:Sulfotransferase family protein n=1 Tax=Nocardioides donggukensis TaxID=2774019 RepID=A0A927PZW5_9ACTN|nr:hypothetical protein [Nocardioides donggukensis]MBD8870868.1 hypothetical protein [Nocardioides donggukensis]